MEDILEAVHIPAGIPVVAEDSSLLLPLVVPVAAGTIAEDTVVLRRNLYSTSQWPINNTTSVREIWCVEGKGLDGGWMGEICTFVLRWLCSFERLVSFVSVQVEAIR